MIDLTMLPPAGAGRSPAAGDTPETGADGFMARLTQALESAGGEAVDAETLQAWLDGESPDGLPLLAELKDLLQHRLPVEQMPDVPTERIDVAGLLQALIAAGATGKTGDGKSMPLLQGQSNGASSLRRFLDAVPAPAPTHQAAQAVPVATPVVENPAARVEPPALTVATPPGQQGFGAAVGERMIWMVRNDVQEARIQLNPRELGPLEIKLTLKGDQASVTLAAHHALTRDAITADVPRLRAMLAEQGFTSVDVNVSQQQT